MTPKDGARSASDGTTDAPCALLPHLHLTRVHKNAYDHSYRYLDLGSARRTPSLGLQPKLGLRAGGGVGLILIIVIVLVLAGRI